MNKKEIESKVFKEFAKHHPAKFELASLRNVSPPKPDIEINRQDGKIMAFEISEILDEAMIRKLQSSVIIEKLCAEYYRKLPSGQNKVFSKKYSNSFICITFEKNTTLNQRRRIIPSIFDFLLSLASIQRENIPSNLNKIVQKIVIENSASSNPVFGVNSWGTIKHPLIERIRDKFSKKYEITHPTELLLFYNLQPVAHEFIFNYACRYAQTHIRESKFQRIWIYLWPQDEILAKIENKSLIANRST